MKNPVGHAYALDPNPWPTSFPAKLEKNSPEMRDVGSFIRNLAGVHTHAYRSSRPTRKKRIRDERTGLLDGGPSPRRIPLQTDEKETLKEFGVSPKSAELQQGNLDDHEERQVVHERRNHKSSGVTVVQFRAKRKAPRSFASITSDYPQQQQIGAL
ncbi:hypothetical protein KM043_016171 [Ampulex compressa]|nr:hypothetical protein KM043_016171 [Ampulex compressa]